MVINTWPTKQVKPWQPSIKAQLKDSKSFLLSPAGELVALRQYAETVFADDGLTCVIPNQESPLTNPPKSDHPAYCAQTPRPLPARPRSSSSH